MSGTNFDEITVKMSKSVLLVKIKVNVQFWSNLQSTVNLGSKIN